MIFSSKPVALVHSEMSDGGYGKVDIRKMAVYRVVIWCDIGFVALVLMLVVTAKIPQKVHVEAGAQ